jgi:hypothetical protein
VDGSLAIVITVVVIALAFDYTNGFHDAANAIATSVSTRALTPRVALSLAAVMNFVGALLGQEVAKTVSDTIGTTGLDASHGLVIVLAGLVGAIVWNLVTWYFGLPSPPPTPSSAGWSARHSWAARPCTGRPSSRRSSSRWCSRRCSASPRRSS